jgi:hypothetical protein
MEQLVPLLTTQAPLSCRTASEASRCFSCGRRVAPANTSSRSVVLNICYEKDNVNMVHASRLLAIKPLLLMSSPEGPCRRRCPPPDILPRFDPALQLHLTRLMFLHLP